MINKEQINTNENEERKGRSELIKKQFPILIACKGQLIVITFNLIINIVFNYEYLILEFLNGLRNTFSDRDMNKVLSELCSEKNRKFKSQNKSNKLNNKKSEINSNHDKISKNGNSNDIDEINCRFK